MTNERHALMTDALRLTRGGRVADATAVLQRGLAGASTGPSAEPSVPGLVGARDQPRPAAEIRHRTHTEAAGRSEERRVGKEGRWRCVRELEKIEGVFGASVVRR